MTAAQASRIVCIVASIATVVIMLIAMGPFADHRESGDFLLALLLFPLLAIWAVGPYMVANRFAAEIDDVQAWSFAVIQVLIGAVVMLIYVDAFLIEPKPDPQSGLVFAIFPLYQFIAVLGAYYGVRLWRQWR
ncbi:MAG: hypothetical protein EXR11_12120 [Rhodospirillaceae bacterium]|nr:hypothetical protein [Rhodospirillaceae bacterium]